MARNLGSYITLIIALVVSAITAVIAEAIFGGNPRGWFMACYVMIFIVGLIYSLIWGSPKCMCGGELKCVEMNDPVGINITRKSTFSLYIGPRKMKYTWKCKKCGKTTVEKEWC